MATPIANAERGEVQSLNAPREIRVRVRKGTYLAVLTPDLVAGGYTIAIPELPGVFTEAVNLTEARAMVREVVALWLDEAESKRRTRAR